MLIPNLQSAMQPKLDFLPALSLDQAVGCAAALAYFTPLLFPLAASAASDGHLMQVCAPHSHTSSQTL